MSKDLPVVVIAPVKNEEWILNRFLAVCSEFADAIIVADQNSSDSSRDICQRFAKVQLINNKESDYDEATRQNLLIEEARKRFPAGRIILALDADEIIAADSLETEDWQRFLGSTPGTTLMVEKPDLYLSVERCIRWENRFPIGYVDDGKEHIASRIHSRRIPPANEEKIFVSENIKFLHYASANPRRQQAKGRLYSVVENVNRTNPLRRRRRRYHPSFGMEKLGRLRGTNPEWFRGWENKGIEMRSIREEKFTWHDFEVLRFFHRYGERRFWFENIWYFPWKECRNEGLSQNISGLPEGRVRTPPSFVLKAGKLLDMLLGVPTQGRYER
jgi:glycosyltransferase involved in cell wall biosynthesis